MDESIIILDSDETFTQQKQSNNSMNKDKISEKEPKVYQNEKDHADDFTNKKRESQESDIQRVKPRRKYTYEAIEENLVLEAEVEKIKNLSGLTPEQIEYMVLRDINYYIDIFSGNCDHSWRHIEYKKYSKKSGNLLYANTAITSYTYDQYMSAVKALQTVFCKKDHKYDEYIVKVLLPEALIKICMRIYQCGKDSAEDYLAKNNIKTSFVDYPRGSAVYSPANKSKIKK